MYVYSDMKIGNRLIRFIVICLASVFLCMADDFVNEKVCDEDSVHEIISCSSFSGKCVDCSFSATVAQCSVPRNSTSANSLRTSIQSQRHNTGNSSRTGFTMVKAGKSMNEYSTSLFRKSIVTFPSGMNESNHHLISLGKLII